ncbi:hypothetical protein TW86_04765 [Halomonas sp. S2151]|nr:hypothetical protein TW86_04765 [Halomonas sp. S2151]
MENQPFSGDRSKKARHTATDFDAPAHRSLIAFEMTLVTAPLVGVLGNAEMLDVRTPGRW